MNATKMCGMAARIASALALAVLLVPAAAIGSDSSPHGFGNPRAPSIIGYGMNHSGSHVRCSWYVRPRDVRCVGTTGNRRTVLLWIFRPYARGRMTILVTTRYGPGSLRTMRDTCEPRLRCY